MKASLFFFPIIVIMLFGGIAGGIDASETPEVFVQLGHGTYVNSVAFSHDGKYLITVAGDKKAIVWDLKARRELWTLRGHSKPVYAAAFSPDGKYIVTGNDNELFISNISTGRIERKLSGQLSGASCVAFTPDGRRLLSSGPDNTIRIWDIATGAETGIFKGHRNSTQAITVSHDGRIVASGGWDKEIILWEISTGKELRRLGPFKSAHGIAFSADGTRVAANNYQSVKVWNTKTGKEERDLQSPGKKFSFIALSPDGRYALSQNDHFTTGLWDLRTGKQIKTYEGFRYTGSPAAITRDGRFAVVTSDEFSFITWNLQSGEKGTPLAGYADECFSHVYHEKTSLAISASFYNALRLWNIDKGDERQLFKRKVVDFPGDLHFSNAVAISRSGKTAAATDGGRNVVLYDLAAQKERMVLSGHKTYVSAVAFSDDGNYLLSGDGDGEAVYWDIRSGTLLATLKGHRHGIFDCAFSRDGTKAITAEGGFDEGFMKLWDLTSGKELLTFEKHQGGIYSIDLSPDGTHILSGSGDGLLRLWNMSGKLIRTFKGHEKPVYSVTFSPDGKKALSGGRDQTVILWNVETGAMEKQFRGHTDEIISVAFLAEGRRALSGSENGVTRYWNIETGKQYAMHANLEKNEWVSITPEGFFDTSPMGARHLNVRVVQTVYSIDQFYVTFYRPEIVRLACAGGTTPKGETISDVAKKAPAPSVIISSPSEGARVEKESVTLRVKLIDNGGGMGDIAVRVNGTQVSNDTRGIAVRAEKGLADKDLSFDVPLIGGKNEIEVTAWNESRSMESMPAGVAVYAVEKDGKPDLYALVVGINEYRNKSIALKYSVADAELFAKALEATSQPLFGKVHVSLLSSFEETTKEHISSTFEALRGTVKPGDVFLFYDASHGEIDIVEGKEQYFLLTSNVMILSSRHLGRDAMSQTELTKLIGSIPAQKKIIILDTCHAGRAGKELTAALLAQTRGLTESTAVKLLQRSIGSTVFSASSDTQQALEGYRGHGLFTYSLVEGMKGQADYNRDGFIKINELADYVEEQVITISEEVFKRQQIPTNQIGVNFPLGKTVQ